MKLTVTRFDREKCEADPCVVRVYLAPKIGLDYYRRSVDTLPLIRVVVSENGTKWDGPHDEYNSFEHNFIFEDK